MKLRTIVIATIIVILLLLAFTIVLSMLWPSSWNPLLGTSLINISTSLMGIMVGIIVAIFVVERYLEYHRRETQKKEQLLRNRYREYWRGWLHGGFSVLIDTIIHLSYFLLYGSRKWEAVMDAKSEAIKIPGAIGDFIHWLIDTKILKDYMTKERIARLEKGFDEIPKSSITVKREDLAFLVNYMESFGNRLRDQLFLFQPFVDEHFELTSKLVFFARSLDDATDHSKSSLALVTKKGKPPESFHLDDRGKRLFQSLGKEAIKVSKLI